MQPVEQPRWRQGYTAATTTVMEWLHVLSPKGYLRTITTLATQPYSNILHHNGRQTYYRAVLNLHALVHKALNQPPNTPE